MVAALVTLLILSWIGLATVVGLGYAGHWGLVEPVRHVYLALPSFLLGILGHSMTMFYFIGTGKVVREAVQDAGLEGDWIARTKTFKQQTFPAAMWAMGFIMATSILGGAVDTGHLAGWIHGLLGIGTLITGARAVVFEIVCISSNLDLLDGLDKSLVEQGDAGSAS